MMRTQGEKFPSQSIPLNLSNALELTLSFDTLPTHLYKHFTFPRIPNNKSYMIREMRLENVSISWDTNSSLSDLNFS